MTRLWDDSVKEEKYEIACGDSLERLKTVPDNTFDSIVTDPPYGLGTPPDASKMLAGWLEKGYFEVGGGGILGHKWDAFVPQPILWKECLRVLKPGGHLLAFAGSRTQDVMGLALRISGFEMRDVIMWVYSSGKPMGREVTQDIDRLMGVERIKVGFESKCSSRNGLFMGGFKGWRNLTIPTSPEAKEWHGWNTTLKPAYEPILMVRKPLEGTVAENLLKHGTGAINLADCATPEEDGKPAFKTWTPAITGRFPGNFIRDDSEEVLDLFPGSGDPSRSPARFFYCAKTSREERDSGLPSKGNIHPTVKPYDLMRWCCNLVTRKGGIILDPFMGSGSTGCAALKNGFRFVGIDLTPEYFEISKSRIEHAVSTPNQMSLDLSTSKEDE